MNNPSNRSLTRRAFLGGAAGSLLLPSVVRAAALGAGNRVAASKRIVMGAIGVGGQGGRHVVGGIWTPDGGLVARDDVQFVAVCDVNANRRNEVRDAVNARYGNKLTMLMWAAGHANDVPVDDGVQLVTMLLDKGATLEARDDRGRTALMAAAELGHAEVVDLLLKRGADPHARDTAGKSAADLATAAPVQALLAAAAAP